MIDFFKIDGPLYNFLMKLWNLLILNFLLVLTSLPIITIGAAQTAGFTVTTKMIHSNETKIIPIFFASLKKNFKKSTISWLLLLMAIIIMSINWSYIISFNKMNSWMTIGIIVVTVILLNFFQYVFFYISRVEESLKKMCMNIVKLSFLYPFRSVFMLIVMFFPIITMLLSPVLFVFGLYINFFIGFSFMLFLRTFLLLDIFKRF